MILNKENLKDLYQNAPCGYLLMKDDGSIVNANNTLLEWLGYEREEIVLEKTFQDLVGMGGKIYFETHLIPLLQMQKEISEINLELERKDSSKIPVLLNAKLVQDSPEDELIYRVALSDMTQRKLYEEELLLAQKEAEEKTKQLKQINEELERFAHSISHDLQAPLNTITSLISLYEEEGLSENEEKIKEFFSLVATNTDRMRMMIRDLLSYSKIDTKTKNLDPVSLKEVCQEALELLHADIQKHNATFDIGDLPTVMGERSQLVRLFQNLFSNAMKYRSEEDPVIEVYSEKGDDFYTIRVKDNGMGIDREDEEKVFEFMERLDTDKSIEGTGIGLSTCKRVVENHGGNITVCSEAGDGCTFSFTLPLVEQEENVRE
ncbi:sensor histidine kinase [Fodinibius halophilus]|uniref:histidine kinase n=1 Tax=Fodinibius halophilus TaxID=1736908 RepID=A0A6M1T8Z8_9BACT|nr:ATP-binding protein [Fodinibius halophilus]NGP88451.1 PAS domain-containing protein [Fodinibius halophilus]